MERHLFDEACTSLAETVNERDALRGEVERLREALNEVHARHVYGDRVGALEKLEAALSSAPPAKTGPACEKCRGYGMQWSSGVLVDCECHSPRVDEPAKPSAVEPVSATYTLALAAWRGLDVIQRENIYAALRFVHVLHHAEKVAALALLRAAAEVGK